MIYIWPGVVGNVGDLSLGRQLHAVDPGACTAAAAAAAAAACVGC